MINLFPGRDPFKAIQLIHECGLYNAVFSFLPPEVSAKLAHPPTAASDSLTASSFLHRLIHPSQSTIPLTAIHPTLRSQVDADPSCKSRLFLAAAFSSYAHSTYEDKKKKSLPAITLLLRESLRLGTQNHFLDGVPALMSASDLLSNPDRYNTPSNRLEIGKFHTQPHNTLLTQSRVITATKGCSQPKCWFSLDKLAAVLVNSRARQVIQPQQWRARRYNS
jgi:tRNA nucleotidyltransferase (CCA-adding enzyme)